MKEIVGIVVTIGMIFGGNAAFKLFHDSVKKAALERTSQGLPALTKMAGSLQNRTEPPEKK